MKEIVNEITKYFPFMRNVFQRKMAYKMSFFMKIIGGLVQLLINFYLWNAIFSSSPSETINSFTSIEITEYIIMSFITSQIININIEWTIADDIVSGTIATYLTKPISYEKKILSESLGNMFLNSITVSLPIWILYSIYLLFTSQQFPYSFLNILLFLVSCFLGYFVTFLFNFIFAISAFYITYIWGILSLKWTVINFLSGQMIPIAFFPEGIKRIFILFPFASMNYIPVMIYMGKLSYHQILTSMTIQVVWVIVLFGIFNFLWRKAIQRVTILGG